MTPTGTWKIITIEDIPEDQWEGWDELDKLGRITTPINILGVHMHLDAILVADDQGRQRALLNGSLDSIKAGVGVAGEKFDTVTMRGREFVLVATPFSG